MAEYAFSVVSHAIIAARYRHTFAQPMRIVKHKVGENRPILQCHLFRYDSAIKTYFTVIINICDISLCQ